MVKALNPGNSALPIRWPLLADQGRANDARDLRAPVYGWFTEGFDTADLRELLDETLLTSARGLSSAFQNLASAGPQYGAQADI
jgi:hypothetical protein